MNYENINNPLMQFSFEKKYFYSIFGLYLFSLGSLVLGYSFYLLLESTGLVEKYYYMECTRSILVFNTILCCDFYFIYSSRVP